MIAHRDLKKAIRARQEKMVEPHTAVPAPDVPERPALLGQDAESPNTPERVDAVVLEVDRQTVHVRVLGEDAQIIFRTRHTRGVVPGHLVTLSVDERLNWQGHAYATGRIEKPRIAVEQLGMDPLPLVEDAPEDSRSAHEPFCDPDPYAPLWRKLTAKPRVSFAMDPIAWGILPAFEKLGSDRRPTAVAVELAEVGNRAGARQVLMRALCVDLRCLDAHALLGNLEFDRAPKRANLHFEIGVRIGRLSLPDGFDGVLPWGLIYNRPFLRCLHGHGLCLWRLGKLADAQQVFEQLLLLNPNDNQGVRYCWHDVRSGRSWKDAQEHQA